MLPDSDDYETLREAFRWSIPGEFNIGVACADAPARDRPAATAIVDPSASVPRLDFETLARRSHAFAASLRQHGLTKGDRIAILLPQGHEAAIAHLAIYKLGAIAVPLAHVFRADALDFRLRDAGVACLVTDGGGAARVRALRASLPALRLVVSTQTAGDTLGFDDLIAEAPNGFRPEPTLADDPALMIYTSGTTGQPKGTLHAHRVLLGHLPGFEFSHAPLGENALFWTPSDWAWAGGLLNVLLPALSFGKAVLVSPAAKFDGAAALALIGQQGVSHAFLPPTALRMLRAADEAPQKPDLASLATAGEALGAESFRWAASALGCPADEFYGQTECNYVLGSCARRGVSRGGSTGKALPGARITLLDETGGQVTPGQPGEIAIHRDHPAMFLEYWNRPEATLAKFRGDWMLTGDLAVEDADGYIAFIGRNDDIITSSGYRIGPAEIEDCLSKHEAVALSAVIGRPDPLRTEIVKAFIVLKPGVASSDALADRIRDFVRDRLSAHEYPRDIVFVDALPMTTTGKIMRRSLRDGGA